MARRLVKRRRARDLTGGAGLRSNVSGFGGFSLSAAYPAVSALGQAHSVMNRLSCNQCSLRTLHGNDADPVDPTQMPGWQTASLVAAGSRLLPPLLAQADGAEPSRMSAQRPITVGTLIMMLASPCMRQISRQPTLLWDEGLRGCRAGGHGGACSPKEFERGKANAAVDQTDQQHCRRDSRHRSAAGTSETSDGDRDEDPTTLPWYDHRENGPRSSALMPHNRRHARQRVDAELLAGTGESFRNPRGVDRPSSRAIQQAPPRYC